MNLNNKNIYIPILTTSLTIIAIWLLFQWEFIKLISQLSALLSALGTLAIAFYAKKGYLEFAREKLNEKELDSVLNIIKLINNIDFIGYVKLQNGMVTTSPTIKTIASGESFNKNKGFRLSRKNKDRNVLLTHDLIQEIRKIIDLVQDPSMPYEVRNKIYISSFYKNLKYTNYFDNSIPLVKINNQLDLEKYIILDELKSKNLLYTKRGIDRLEISCADIETDMMKEHISITKLENDFSNLIEAINKWLKINNLEDKQLVPVIVQDNE